MKVDGNQAKSARVIADYIRHYMRYYDLKTYVDSFCGFCNVYRELYKSKKRIDPKSTYYLSDFNPFIISILERLWSKEDIDASVVCDRARHKAVVRELNRRFRNEEDIFESYEGYEDWETGCQLILGTYHQNPVRGYIGDDQYTRNVNELKAYINEVPPPDYLGCMDYMDFTKLFRRDHILFYFDFPEPSMNNIYPFGMYFDRDEFFEYVSRWDNTDNVMIFSSKYFPDNGKYEIIYEAGEEKLYVGKRWYIEDVKNAASGRYKRAERPAQSISENNRRGKRSKVSRSSRKGRSV